MTKRAPRSNVSKFEAFMTLERSIIVCPHRVAYKPKLDMGEEFLPCEDTHTLLELPKLRTHNIPTSACSMLVTSSIECSGSGSLMTAAKLTMIRDTYA